MVVFFSVFWWLLFFCLVVFVFCGCGVLVRFFACVACGAFSWLWWWFLWLLVCVFVSVFACFAFFCGCFVVLFGAFVVCGCLWLLLFFVACGASSWLWRVFLVFVWFFSCCPCWLVLLVGLSFSCWLVLLVSTCCSSCGLPQVVEGQGLFNNEPKTEKNPKNRDKQNKHKKRGQPVKVTLFPCSCSVSYSVRSRQKLATSPQQKQKRNNTATQQTLLLVLPLV